MPRPDHDAGSLHRRPHRPGRLGERPLGLEAGYDNVNHGDWFRDEDDDLGPYLANTESVLMMSLAAMFRATGDPLYLERLAWYADGVLANRDDHRGVYDYRGDSGACWRDMYYSGGPPYCWVLHDGVIIEPMLEFARLVHTHGLGAELAYDGEPFADKAETYTVSAEETAQRGPRLALGRHRHLHLRQEDVGPALREAVAPGWFRGGATPDRGRAGPVPGGGRKFAPDPPKKRLKALYIA